MVDGQTGLLVSPNDPSALADAIVCVLKDEVLAHLLGEAGYHRAFVQHNADVHVLKIQMIYDRLLDQYEKL